MQDHIEADAGLVDDQPKSEVDLRSADSSIPVSAQKIHVVSPPFRYLVVAQETAIRRAGF